MIRIINKSQCTGCTACQQICGHGAISMHFDDDGHLYPLVESTKCVDCGLCEKVCPMVHKERIPIDESLDKLSVYAVYNKDESIRKQSTSGGIFSLLADVIISEGGVVYAARFDECYRIIHASFDKIEDIGPYRGSKYAQSWLGDTFRQIRHDLKTRKVLFVGTPCQIAGLKGFLLKDYDNLYTCDFICMGISSPVMWGDYINQFWEGHCVEEIFFKDKRYGWHQWKMLVKYDGGKEYLKGGMSDPFFNLYLTHLSYRPSCFECPFRTCKRLSDFTIADCWGIDKVAPEFDDNKGCTTIILHSLKAEKVYGKIEPRVFSNEYTIQAVKKYNPYITRQLPFDSKRKDFLRLYREKGFKAAEKKFGYKGKNKALKKIKNIIKKMINR